MKNALHITLALALSTVGWGQFSRVDYAEEMMLRWKYAEAYPVWAELAAEEATPDSLKWGYARKAAIAAYEANFIEEAIAWNDSLLFNSEASASDWVRAFELLCATNRHDSLPIAMSMANLEFPDDPQLQSWTLSVDRLLSLIQDSTAFEVKKLRPQSEAEEFSAFPFEDGLVYMSTGLNAGFLPTVDGWTGQYYTELCRIENLDVPFKRYTWLEQIRNQDVFLAFDHTRKHDGPVAFDRDESYAVITRNQEALDTTGGVLRSRLMIEFWKRYVDEGEVTWQRDEKHPFKWNNPTYSVAHATFALDDDIIIFASDMPGGFGGMDLYTSTWQDGEYTRPENLGPTINTEGDEVFPYVSSTGALFFSSNGHPGVGGLDIFLHRTGASKVERLGYPINTYADDFSFVFDELEGSGWLSSDREDHRDAIYAVKGNPTAAILDVHVQACDGSPMNATLVDLVDVDSGARYTEETDDDGNVEFTVARNRNYTITTQSVAGMDTPPELKTFVGDVEEAALVVDLNYVQELNRITVVDMEGNPLSNVLLSFENEKKQRLNRVTNEFGIFEWGEEIDRAYAAVHVSLINYWDGYQGFEQPPAGCPMSIQKTIALRPKTKESDVINLEVIEYDLDKANLRPEGKRELDKLITYMNRPDYRTYRIEFSSHTDCRNDEAYNLDLSQRRAQSCVDYIVSKGIDPSRIIAKGYGESRLLNGCADIVTCGCPGKNNQIDPNCRECSEAEHQANRRTELRLLPDE